MTTVHVVVPEGIDDPMRPSGGNVYDRRVCAGLASAGWDVREHAVPGAWPRPDDRDLGSFSHVVASLPDGATVLVDGLVASSASPVLVSLAMRAQLVVLAHLSFADAPAGHALPPDIAGEREVFFAAHAVVATSEWLRERLLELYPLSPACVHVAPPGADVGELAPGTDESGALLCVAAVAAHKGHDVLIAALEQLVDLHWHCRCVGPLTREPEFVQRIRRRISAAGLTERISFDGPQSDLGAIYRSSDLLVHPSRGEAYGMVVTEALAHGLPAVVSDTGGLPEALGHARSGRRPGLLVPPDDPRALAGALRAWLTDRQLRTTLRAAAAERRGMLASWTATVEGIEKVLAQAVPR